MISMQTPQLSVNENMRELTPHGSAAFPIQYYVDELSNFPNQTIPLHWHPELEFYIANGSSVHIQLGKTNICLEDGCGIFINSNVLHSFQQAEANCQCLCPNIVFLDEFIAPASSSIYQHYVRPITMNRQLPYIILSPRHFWQKEILIHLDRVFSLLQKYGSDGFFGKPPVLKFEHDDLTSNCFELAVQNELNQIWQLLFAYLREIPLISSAKNEHLLQIRMQKMLGYIQNNYSRQISLEEIAASADISKSEAARCFQAYLHTSPVNYLLQYRIEKARYELSNGMDTIEIISRRCGFQSTSYFCKVFRKQLQMTPKQFRNGCSSCQ